MNTAIHAFRVVIQANRPGRAGCRLRADPDFHMGDCHPGPTHRSVDPLGHLPLDDACRNEVQY